MSTKDAMIEYIRSLPDDVTPRDLAEKVAFKVQMDQIPPGPGPMLTHEEFIRIIDESLRQLDNGEGIPHEEVVKRMAKWGT